MIVLKIEEGKLQHISDSDIVKGELKFNGVYSVKKPGAFYSNYLRFYEDGHTISMAGVAAPDDVAKNFHRDRPNEQGGKYHYDSEGNIRFILKGMSNVEYVGQVGENVLYLTVYSHVTDHHSRDLYKFTLA
ncbi:MAG: hypothetical protein GPJ51_11590 [Candidatus Heimdallarchaeota archaeon]|nr:hypothetical protein [Candidatus Heimdallarchaeota archaeon]